MLPSPMFSDRADAGEKLAQLVLSEISKLDDDLVARQLIVYALPRGGLPVAVPVARLLACPLDIVLAKKITRPDNPELAIGAVTADGHVIWAQHGAFRRSNSKLRQAALDRAQTKAQEQLAHLEIARPKISPQGALAILIDDGIATGMTVACAAIALKAQQPAAIWICAPVAPPELLPSLQEWGDRAFVLATPDPFMSVSRFYADFPQVEMAEALNCLEQQVTWHSPQS